MAEFYFSFGQESISTQKFKMLYKNKFDITTGCSVFYNDNTITHLVKGNQSVTILGYVFNIEKDVKEYLYEILNNFAEDSIPDIKKQLLGQYIAIVYKGDVMYVFSDFLQVRSVYYAIDEKIVCSSFHKVVGAVTDPYKEFEFIAMRHCAYPAWLGNTTLYKDINRLRAFEFLKINFLKQVIEIKNFKIKIDNRKEYSLSKLKNQTLFSLRKVIRHPSFKEQNVHSTITGGYDSRLVTALINEYYTDFKLRIAVNKGIDIPDYTIACKVAKVMSRPLIVFENDLEKMKEWFYAVTDHLTPKENAIMTHLWQHANDCSLGFGGVMGTELQSSFKHDTVDEIIHDFLCIAKQFIPAKDDYYVRFENALRDEFYDIEKQYFLESRNEKDLIRIFKLINTAHFSSPQTTAFNVYGNQFEIFSTFPIVEMALKVPYKYLGDKTTLGRFYLIPKSLMEKINCKVSKITTTHFYPMRPLSVASFMTYLIGRYKKRNHYKHVAKTRDEFAKIKNFEGEGWSYTTSDDWMEGFAKKYLS
ncbi:MAG: hypothetical protein PHQ11_14305 [Paludibacter sp.]|nr:hypothetical protein [Paludibacter sp.]MDD4429240.1 hypothetical protein [Paludibacter sp.]